MPSSPTAELPRPHGSAYLCLIPAAGIPEIPQNICMVRANTLSGQLPRRGTGAGSLGSDGILAVTRYAMYGSGIVGLDLLRILLSSPPGPPQGQTPGRYPRWTDE
ncbi:hypothetical protein Tco_1457311 [Tanacetum coccineum]